MLGGLILGLIGLIALYYFFYFILIIIAYLAQIIYGIGLYQDQNAEYWYNEYEYSDSHYYAERAKRIKIQKCIKSVSNLPEAKACAD